MGIVRLIAVPNLCYCGALSLCEMTAAAYAWDVRATKPMPAMQVLVGFALLCLGAPIVSGQATEVIEPTRDYLLRISQDWGRESSLGDLRALSMGSADIELRFWEGYGIAGTGATIVGRRAGRWYAWHARVETCMLFLPIAVRDTLGDSARTRHERQALRDCYAPRPDTIDAAMVISADTLVLTPADLPPSPDELWRQLVDAGVLSLPPMIQRTWVMLDGHTYVTEVRRGNAYRASVLEHVETPEAEGDRLIQAVARLIHEAFPERPSPHLRPN